MAGIKGVKSGNMAKLRGLTEQQLFKMSRNEMIDLLTSTSKSMTANVRKLMKSEYAGSSMFLQKRTENKYPLPREIKRKTAMRMKDEQLKQELRDLAYTARLETSGIAGTKRFAKKFEQKTGLNIAQLFKDLTPDDWVKIRTEYIEEKGYSSTSAIIAYSEDRTQDLEEIEQSEEEAKQNASDELSNADMFNLLDKNLLQYNR